MRTLSGKKDYQAYIDTVGCYLARIDTQYIDTPFWNTLDQHVRDELHAIEQHPNGDQSMPWSNTNTRFRFDKTLPGLMAEVIAAVNWFQLTQSTIKFAIDQQSQSTDTIDFWITPTINIDPPLINTTNHTYSVQVKAVIFKNEVLQYTNNLLNIRSDYISLVDIDDYHHIIIATNDFYHIIKNTNMITLKLLQSHPARYFDNVCIYGHPEDIHIRKTC